ncbi:unnamed protein product [Allacma fusca]|uniref:ATP synthase mitochondrial F1 complex assembly factor 1 n=1 Tax=Allacma fusca TaxID=39272 RepID=A0A8J2PJT0_9HEXA|nr:unnamed protein product [Allacma fusca]
MAKIKGTTSPNNIWRSGRVNMYSGVPFVCRLGSRTLSSLRCSPVTQFKLLNSSNRNFLTSVNQCAEFKQPSKGVDDPDGFNVANLDSESRHKLQKLKDFIVKNSYFDKYKSKIVEAQRSHPLEFLALLDGLMSTKTKSASADIVPKMTSYTKKRVLEDVMKVSLLLELAKEDVTYIWQEYHRKNNLVAACIPGPIYDRISTRAQICPTFVLPLKRPSGHDFHVLQFSNDTFYFTPLVTWQAYKENSPVALTLTNYDELKSEKDVVLMRGEFDKNIFNLKEAQSLAVQTHLYFAEPDFSRNHLMEIFTSSPSEFQYKELMKELDRMEDKHNDLFKDIITNDSKTN